MKGIKWFTALISPDILKIRLSLTFPASGMHTFDSGKKTKDMTPRMHDNLVKAFFFMIIFMVLLFRSLFTNAEPAKNSPVRFTDGFSTTEIPSFTCPYSQIKN